MPEKCVCVGCWQEISSLGISLSGQWEILQEDFQPKINIKPVDQGEHVKIYLWEILNRLLGNQNTRFLYLAHIPWGRYIQVFKIGYSEGEFLQKQNNYQIKPNIALLIIGWTLAPPHWEWEIVNLVKNVTAKQKPANYILITTILCYFCSTLFSFLWKSSHPSMIYFRH